MSLFLMIEIQKGACPESVYRSHKDKRNYEYIGLNYF